MFFCELLTFNKLVKLKHGIRTNIVKNEAIQEKKKQ